MKTISRSDIPPNYTYYRTGSRVWFDYYKKYSRQVIHRIGSGYEFLRAERIFESPFWNVLAEKIDIEPKVGLLKKL